jgi:tRNA nucleotidyltransferase (CCA-adding enzyme)
MKISLDKIPTSVLEIINKLNNAGFEVYLCGGAVRDLIMNCPPKDYDICTSATPSEVISIFYDYEVVPIGISHGTVAIINKLPIEVTTFRHDGKYLDGRHPDSIEYVKSFKEDIARRDFTINALGMNIHGDIIDYFGGLEDINSKLVRCVGNPKIRYNEDYLRLLRCIRFAAQLNFHIEEHTLHDIYNLVDNIQYIAIERIREEFNKIIISKNIRRGINLLVESKLMKYIIPEIYECVNFDHNNVHHDKTVYDHLICTVEEVSDKIPLRLAALLHDIGKPICYSQDENGQGHFYNHNIVSADMAKEILTRMKYDTLTIEKVYILIREHMQKFPFIRNSSIKKLINRVGKDNLDELFELMDADIRASKPPHDFTELKILAEEVRRILNEKEPLTTKDLNINGYDLMTIGYEPGRELGKILKYLLEKVLDQPELNIKEKLLEIVKNM